MELRPYQGQVDLDLRASIRKGSKSPLIVLPTGGGKTCIFSHFAASAAQKGNDVLILAHRAELLTQISEALAAFSVPHGFIAPGEPYDYSHKVQVGSVLTTINRLHYIKKPRVIISDEAHHCIPGSTWGRILSSYPDAIKIGVTATPERLSGEPLSDIFDDMILGPSVRELMDMGYLTQYRMFCPGAPDTSSIKKRAGDYVISELSQIVDKPSITGSAIKEYVKHACGKRAIVFCCTVEHAEHVRQQFQAAGFYSASIDGKMPREIRRQVIQNFRSGSVPILTSVNVVSEGFDLPAIETAILLRPTQSLSLYLQQVGRALRPFPGKEKAIILDHAGNAERHGYPCEDREWTLEGRVKRSKNVSQETKELSVKICPTCKAAQFNKNQERCEHCGSPLPKQEREILEVDGDLVEIDPQKIRIQKKREQGSANSLEDLVELGIKRGYKNPRGWAKIVFNARQLKKIKGGKHRGIQ